MLTLLEKTQSIHTYTAGKKTQSIHAYIDETNLKAWNKPQKTYAYIVGKETPKELLICTHTQSHTYIKHTQKRTEGNSPQNLYSPISVTTVSALFSILSPWSVFFLTLLLRGGRDCMASGLTTSWPVSGWRRRGGDTGTKSVTKDSSPGVGRMLHEMAVNAKYITMDSLTQTGTARDITSVPETRCLQWAECSMKWLLRELSLSHLQCLGHHRTKTSMDALLKCVFFYICIKHDS